MSDSARWSLNGLRSAPSPAAPTSEEPSADVDPVLHQAWVDIALSRYADRERRADRDEAFVARVMAALPAAPPAPAAWWRRWLDGVTAGGRRGRPAGRGRDGFTVIEMITVVGILLLLLATGFPVWRYIQRNSELKGTRTLINAVATAITNYPTRTWSVLVDTGGGNKQIRLGHLWDLNSVGGEPLGGDGLIDGSPAETASDSADGPFTRDLVRSGYRGFLAMTQAPIVRRSINAKGQVKDPWGQPLHISFHPTIYGTTGFGVWSTGPDRVDGTADDIQSWRENGD